MRAAVFPAFEGMCIMDQYHCGRALSIANAALVVGLVQPGCLPGDNVQCTSQPFSRNMRRVICML